MAASGPTVFVVDDDEAILDALTTMAKTIKLPVETFASAQEFLDTCDPSRPGCLMIDVRLPGMSGLDLLDEAKERGFQLPVIVISGYGDVPLAVRAMKAGAIEFLEKPFKEQDLLDRIHAAFQIDEAQRRHRALIQADQQRYARLTPREKELMELLVQGRSGKQMACELCISYKTMEKLRAGVMRKMEAGSVAELALMAVRVGILSVDAPRASRRVEKRLCAG